MEYGRAREKRGRIRAGDLRWEGREIVRYGVKSGGILGTLGRKEEGEGRRAGRSVDKWEEETERKEGVRWWRKAGGKMQDGERERI